MHQKEKGQYPECFPSLEKWGQESEESGSSRGGQMHHHKDFFLTDKKVLRLNYSFCWPLLHGRAGAREGPSGLWTEVLGFGATTTRAGGWKTGARFTNV
jgi:hypothetical protein